MVTLCHRNSCVAVARFCNLTLQNLYRHILYPMLKEEGCGVTTDRYGATDLMQYCLSREIPVTLMIASGTSLHRDGPAGYTQAMQEIQFMTSDRALANRAGSALIKSVIFPAPLIPSLKPPRSSDSPVLILSKYRVEASNMGRLACLRASEPRLMYISNTEFVQNSEYQDDSLNREASSYSFLGGLKSYRFNKMPVEMKTLKLTSKVVFPRETRSTEHGALKLRALAEYSKAVHYDFNQVSLS